MDPQMFIVWHVVTATREDPDDPVSYIQRILIGQNANFL